AVGSGGPRPVHRRAVRRCAQGDDQRVRTCRSRSGALRGPALVDSSEPRRELPVLAHQCRPRITSLGNGGVLAGGTRFLDACSYPYANAISCGSENARPANVMSDGNGTAIGGSAGVSVDSALKPPGTATLGSPAFAVTFAVALPRCRVASKSSFVPGLPSGPLNTPSSASFERRRSSARS